MVEYTIETLVAKGLTEEEAKTYLENLKEKEKSSTKIPFDTAKITYPMSDIFKITKNPDLLGKLLGGFEKDEDGKLIGFKYNFGDKPEIRILKKLGQYSVYDNDKGGAILSSNIFNIRNAKKAYLIKDVKDYKGYKFEAGTLIKDVIKKVGKIPYQNVILLEAKDIESGEWIPIIWYLSGKIGWEFNDKIDTSNYVNSIIKFEIIEEGNYYKIGEVEITPLSDEEVFKCLVKDAKNIKKFDEWVEKINSKIDDIDEDIDDETTEEISNSNNPFENI